jgi:hypothetical protein
VEKQTHESLVGGQVDKRTQTKHQLHQEAFWSKQHRSLFFTIYHAFLEVGAESLVQHSREQNSMEET